MSQVITPAPADKTEEANRKWMRGEMVKRIQVEIMNVQREETDEEVMRHLTRAANALQDARNLLQRPPREPKRDAFAELQRQVK